MGWKHAPAVLGLFYLNMLRNGVGIFVGSVPFRGPSAEPSECSEFVLNELSDLCGDTGS